MASTHNYYNGLFALSFNAIFTFIITNRNHGKTWTFKRRAFRRAIKHNHKTLWVRTFKKEVKECVASFYSSIDLQKFCGIVPYDKDTKEGNLKQEGNTFYYRRHKKDKWKWFLKVCAVSDSNTLRSADDVKLDTIIYDEFTTTLDKFNRYHGNVVNDFIDLFFSMKREHKVRCVFLGNKECIRNPFYVYFNIKALPMSFNGIKRFRKGSIIVQQVNNKAKNTNEYDNQVHNLLNGTSYGNYIYKSTYKNTTNIKKRKTPSNAQMYVQLDINNYPIRISVLDGNYYVNNTIDIKRRVCTLKPLNKYENEILLIKRYKSEFIGLIDALSNNTVYYDNDTTFESIQEFYTWLGL